MPLLYTLDIALFRFINGSLQNSFFDLLMPFISGNRFFYPGIIIFAAWMIFKCGPRGRLFVFFIVCVIALGDGVICKLLKETIARPRPFLDLADVHIPEGIGRTSRGSFPSSHAANWFAATMVAYIFYRRSWRFMLPVACLVAFSRVYNGVHYPSDVLGGAILGAGYGFAIVWLINFLWRTIGSRWFPLWWQNYPSLVSGKCDLPPSAPFIDPRSANVGLHWLRLGYVLIFSTLAARLIYLASGKIELTEDEAYQWLWSKHLALSYFSKPPLIAYTQWLGTHIWGDTQFGVRFFSPVIAALTSMLVLRFMAREAYPRLGVVVVLATTAAPMLAAGAVLMTIDPLSVLFWTAAMISGWRAVQLGSTKQWVWAGFWMGLGFLAKYTALFQLLSWILFFALVKAARPQMRRRGPWLAFLVMGLCSVPVFVWNAQNHWPTIAHLQNRAGLDQQWKPTLNFLLDFVASEFALLNPVFFVLAVWAAFAFWRREKNNPLLFYLFSMGAPVFVIYFFYTLRARVQPNWIAPSILPMFCLAVLYWQSPWRETSRYVKKWFIYGTVVGTIAVVLIHDTRLIERISGHALPVEKDPLTRARGWRAMAETVAAERKKLLTEGKPVFILGAHYGITGLLSFYLPEAREKVSTEPLVFYPSSEKPMNQFYFWPGYKERKNQNALFVQRIKAHGDKEPVPESLVREFGSISDLGEFEITERGKPVHLIHLFACRNLK